MTPETDSIDWLDADPDEAVRWTGRPGVSPVVPFLLIGVGVGLFGVFLAALLTSPSSPLRFVLIGLFIGLGLFAAGWRSAEQRSVAYAITTNAVYEKRASAADVSMVPLTDIESASVEQSALAGILGRGTVRCYTPAADRTTLTLDGISDPEAVYTLLTDRHGTIGDDRGAVDIGFDRSDPGPNTTDSDATDAGSGIDRSDAAGNTVRAYVVDATDDAVLLRAFPDVSTADLKRGRRVSLTIRSDLDGDPSLESRRTPATDSFDPANPSESSLGSDAGPDLEPPDDHRVGHEGVSENDEDDGDQFVWGSTSIGDWTAVDDREGPETDSDVPDADSDGYDVGTERDRDADDHS